MRLSGGRTAGQGKRWPERYPRTAAGRQYAEEVVAGKLPACKWVRLACQRHLEDLKRSRKKEWPYKFDARRAEDAVHFIENLPHIKGEQARVVVGRSNLLRLEPWQLFIVSSVFGWLRKSDGARRFREVFCLIPRKNGKSTLAAGIGLYMMVADGEEGAEVYSGATTEKQAMIVFRTAREMVRRTPEMRKYFALEPHEKRIVSWLDGSRFEALVGKPGDGASPNCAIIDEYHEHESSELHDVMQTGMAARRQGLMFNISTAGSSIAGPCYLLQMDVQKVLDKVVENESLFGIIYSIDEGDDWKDERVWRKANPNYGVSVYPEYIREAVNAAVQSARLQNVTLTKHFNVWVNAATAWMNMEKWRTLADPTLKMEDFAGEPCWNGNDLAAKIDLASSCFVFRRQHEDGQVHYYAFWRHYVPQLTAFSGEHQNYEQWVHEGRMVAHEGAEIQLRGIQQDLEATAEKYEMRAMAFDPWSALQMQQELQAKFGADRVVTVPQTVQQLSDVMKEVQAAVHSGRFHHNGDPVAGWAMSNVLAHEDANENIFPRKEKHGRSKIDPVSALLTAMRCAYSAPLSASFEPFVI